MDTSYAAGGRRFFVDDGFPFVVARAPSGANATVDIADFYAEWDAVLARGPHGVLIDFQDVDSRLVGTRARRAMAGAAAARRPDFQRHLRAEARVCACPAVRAILTAFDWMVGSSSGHPTATFEDADEAATWLRAQLGLGDAGARCAPASAGS